VNSPAGTTTIWGQRAQSLKSVSPPGTRQMAGGAARRSGGDSASRCGCCEATSAAVLALSSAMRASSFACAGRVAAAIGDASEIRPCRGCSGEVRCCYQCVPQRVYRVYLTYVFLKNNKNGRNKIW
jgi:hypothetical protein